jgi:hypothetical protein
MPDETRPNNSKVFQQVAEGLKSEPAYLLVFGISALVFLSGFGAASYGIATGKDAALYLGFALSVIALLAAVYVIKLVLDKHPVVSAEKVEQTKKLLVQRLTYIKVIHMARKEAGREPIYRRAIERLKHKSIFVYDEELFVTVVTYSAEQPTHKWDYRSSGVVDPGSIFPWKSKLVFSDKGLADDQQYVQQTIAMPSNTCVSMCQVFNGLQPGHEDLAMKMWGDTDHARLVVDFSSIPEAHLIFKVTQAVSRIGNQEEHIEVEECKRSVFTCSHDQLKEGQVLRIDFEIDWDKVDAQRPKTDRKP